MRGPLLILATVATCGLAWYFRCRHVNTRRHILGSFLCPDCGASFASLPTLDVGHVPPLRRTFERKHGGEVTRAGWVQ